MVAISKLVFGAFISTAAIPVIGWAVVMGVDHGHRDKLSSEFFKETTGLSVCSLCSSLFGILFTLVTLA